MNYKFNKKLWDMLPDLVGVSKADWVKLSGVSKNVYYSVSNGGRLEAKLLTRLSNQFHVPMRCFIIDETLDESNYVLALNGEDWKTVMFRPTELKAEYKAKYGQAPGEKFYEAIGLNRANYATRGCGADSTMTINGIIAVCNLYELNPFAVLTDSNEFAEHRARIDRDDLLMLLIDKVNKLEREIKRK